MKTKDLIYGLLRDHEDRVGASNLTHLVSTLLRRSIDAVKTNSSKELLSQFYEFIWIINRSEPKIVTINNTLNNLLWIVKKNQDKLLSKDIEFVKGFIKAEIDNREDNAKRNHELVIELGANCIQDKDIIMVHSISSTIFGILEKAKKDHKVFKVIVAQQEPKKTDIIIEHLRENKISTEVIPEYAINHVMEKVTKIFFGSLSITSDGYFLANIGTKSIIAIAKLRDTPIYLFSSSLKFSIDTKHEQNIHEKRDLHHVHDMVYHVLKFSHDFIDIKNIDYIVTDGGKHDAKDFDKLYAKIVQNFLYVRALKDFTPDKL